MDRNYRHHFLQEKYDFTVNVFLTVCNDPDRRDLEIALEYSMSVEGSRVPRESPYFKMIGEDLYAPPFEEKGRGSLSKEVVDEKIGKILIGIDDDLFALLMEYLKCNDFVFRLDGLVLSEVNSFIKKAIQKIRSIDRRQDLGLEPQDVSKILIEAIDYLLDEVKDAKQLLQDGEDLFEEFLKNKYVSL